MPAAFVQSVTAATSGATTIALAFGSTTAGNTIAVGWFMGTQARTFNSISGSSSGAYTLKHNPTQTTNFQACMAYKENIAGGADTLTCTASGNCAQYGAANEISGMNTASFDNSQMQGQNTPGTGTDGCLSGAGTQTPSVNGCYVFGCSGSGFGGSGPTLSAGTGFTGRANGSSSGVKWRTEDQVQTTATAVNASFTTTSNEETLTGQMFFKPPGGGATAGLFMDNPMSGLGVGGPFFADPLEG